MRLNGNTLIMLFILLGLTLIAVLNSGCASPASVVDRTIQNVIRVDTLQVIKKETKYDTVWITNGNGESIRYIVKTDTLWKRIMIKSKPDTIYVPITDTVTVTRTEIKTVESDDLSTREMFYYAFGLVGMILLVTVLRK